VIDMAILHGTLPQGVDRTYTLQVPDLMIKDLAKAATTLQGVTQSLVTAEDRGWIRSETAARCVHVVMSQIGVEVDSVQEFRDAQDNKQTATPPRSTRSTRPGRILPMHSATSTPHAAPGMKSAATRRYSSRLD
jgi:hypothetical protein